MSQIEEATLLDFPPGSTVVESYQGGLRNTLHAEVVVPAERTFVTSHIPSPYQPLEFASPNDRPGAVAGQWVDRGFTNVRWSTSDHGGGFDNRNRSIVLGENNSGETVVYVTSGLN